MCAVFGFLDYKEKVSNAVLKKLIHYLSVAAEVRGTDATGIAYVRGSSIVTYKKPKPAHKVKLFFPRDTRAVIGHTRFTTQGSEKRNCNNHPFEGHCGTETFALAHNGVLYNDREHRREQHLPPTSIETDTYVAVQLLEQGQQLDTENIKRMAELVEGSFVFTILRNDNTLFLVKGNNPLTIYHFPALGLYVYASTKSILDNALKKVKLNDKHCEVDISEGEILEINSAGNLSRSTFTMQDYIHTMFNPYNWNQLDYAKWWMEDEREELLLEYCGTFGVSEEEVELLLEVGYDPDEIEELLMDTAAMEEALTEAKALLQCEA
ncbi:class II glutamine amidotransferase [Ruminococcus callidus]|jgi:glucosamine--fructose-6-phosphate aminotransferase (isomerizing)|uniref:class II glutamine amidotransferase n=1 Tax=Ruminococcus callidus TaxID=40519 RepID=UPI00266FE7BA|nr:class II glutamine amidotransferase [uncultured Ruminococcus sp.]